MRKMTLDDVADLYKLKTGQQARIRPIDVVVEWACEQPEVWVDEDDDGQLYLKEDT